MIAPHLNNKQQAKGKIMIKLLRNLGAVAALAVIGAGCATPYPLGTIYTEVKLPAAAGGDVSTSRVGIATSTSILGLVATGDSSITAAARNGNISRISHVDFNVRNILGIYGEYTTTVYGD